MAYVEQGREKGIYDADRNNTHDEGGGKERFQKEQTNNGSCSLFCLFSHTSIHSNKQRNKK